jgi:DNA modification methylase
LSVLILIGDVRARLAAMPAESVQCIVTSPPYWGLRDYGVAGQIGLEATPGAYVAALVEVFRAARRVLRADGTLWLNLGDSYAGSWGAAGHRETDATLSRNQIANHPKRAAHTGTIRDVGLKPKDLVGIPWAVAFALRADGWWLRGDHVWAKPNGMPESVTDRPTRGHEYVFLLSRSEVYRYDREAVMTAPKASTVTRIQAALKKPDESPAGIKYDPENTPSRTIRSTEQIAHSLARRDKQRGHGRRHIGFNERWDAMEKDEQMAMGANLRSVWWVPPAQFSEAHFAVMPDLVAEICIRAGCPEGGTVLDPFGGAGTTGLVADRLGRDAVLIELNPDFAAMAAARIRADGGMLADVTVEEAPSFAKATEGPPSEAPQGAKEGGADG